ncbi:MAG: DegT/DnrJ/EryC1/StrS family aminotransferase [Armatimonadota bacterium]
MIPVARPDLSEIEVQEVLSVLRTPYLSLGPKLREFEDRMAALLGVRYAVAVSSGTAGLHLAVRAAGIGEGDEVITTPFSFVASSNVLLYEHAIPVFVDIQDRTLDLSPNAVEEAITRHYARTGRGLINRHSGRRLAGLLPVDVFGHPVDIDGFRAISAQYDLRLIEDSCEALGSEVRSADGAIWTKVGSRAELSVFAFYPNKQMTTGEGGLVATNDEVFNARCRTGRNQGRSEGSAWLEHATLGFNYRLDELSAALGIAQLKRFDELTRKRTRVAQIYDESLRPIEELRLPHAEPWARVNWFVYVVRVADGIDRDALGQFLTERGIENRVYFPPVHLQPYYRKRFDYAEGAFPVCEAAGRTTLALPFFNDLTEEQIGRVAEALQEGVHACAKARRR